MSTLNVEKRGVERIKLEATVGSTILDGKYRLLEDTLIEERHLRLLRLEHVQTRAQHIHLEADDSNNAFTVIFKTLPTDNSGKAHVLEHLALCGSQRFPVRDPFFHMLSRSLNTYMNAWTGGDFTQYPFTTQNAQDYQNLLNIYLDATFFPLLHPLDFMQEGHRLDFLQSEQAAAPPSGQSPLCFKGVVFNEMKGAMGDPNRRFMQSLEQTVLPDTPYAFNSGGEPLDIPSLTYESLQRFHQDLYHPSNATFITYGDLPLQHHLSTIDSYLSRFQHRTPPADAPLQPRFPSPREATVALPPMPGVEDDAPQTKVAQTWMLHRTDDVFETFSLGVLASLLTNGPNSPLYQALIASGLGADMSPGSGFHTETPMSLFSVGLTGVQEANVPKVLQAIQLALEAACAHGFSEERIRALLHQMEIGIKYVRGNFGIELISNLTSAVLSRASISESLRVVSLIERLKKELNLDQPKGGPLNHAYFQDLIRKYFLDNTHRVTLIGRPDPDFVSRDASREAEMLSRAVITPEQQAAIDALAVRQAQPPQVDCLPTLRVPEDISPYTPQLSHQRQTIGRHNIDFLTVDQPTNSLSSFRLISLFPSTSVLPVECYYAVPIFCFVFTQMGTRHLLYPELAQWIENYTSDVTATPHFCHLPHSLDQYEVGVQFSGLCLSRNHEHMFQIFEQLFTATTPFDDFDRLEVLLMQYASSISDNLVASGHQFSVARSKSSLSPLHAVSDLWHGLTAFKTLQELTASMQDHRRDQVLTQLSADLRTIAQAVLHLNPKTARCMVVSEPSFCQDTSASLQVGIRNFLDNVSISDQACLDSGLPASLSPQGPLSEIYEVPLGVSFLGQSLPGLAMQDQHAIPLMLACRLLSKKYLHNEIREKGGAYGAGVFSAEGVISYYTYRDPNPSRSLRVVESSLEWLADPQSFTEQDIQEVKLGSFAELDTPTPPTQKGVKLFKNHITHDIAQARRTRLLACTRQDIMNAANAFLNVDQSSRNSVIVGQNVQAQLPQFKLMLE